MFSLIWKQDHENTQDWGSVMTIQASEEKGEIYLDKLQENLHNSNQCQKCQMQNFTKMQ